MQLHRYRFLRFILLVSCSFTLLAQTPIEDLTQPGSQPLHKCRVLSIFPDYESVSVGAPVAPLSIHQKFQIFAGQTFDPSIVLIAAAVAGGQQIWHFAPRYGQGAAGFSQRFGAASASLATGSLLSEAVMPTIFRQDPRYFRKRTGNNAARFWYAINRTLVTRQDSGASSFNYSQISAVAITTASTNLYYPSMDRTVSGNASRFAIGIGVSALLNVVREFTPGHSK